VRQPLTIWALSQREPSSKPKAWDGAIGFQTGKAEHTITSGIEGAWKPNPTRWDQGISK
jgi:catalase (peroxidase I)